MRALICTALFVGLALPALGADTPNPPPIFGAPDKVSATMHSNPVGGVLHLGRQTVRFEDTGLMNLSERMEAPIGYKGEGRDAMSWICLTDTAAQTRMWLVSHDESDGAIDALTLVHLPKVQANEHCPDTPGAFAKVELPNGIRLGMTGEALKARLGAPSYDNRGLLAFFYTGPVLIGDANGKRAAELFAAVGPDGVGAVGLHQRTSTL